MFNKLLYTVLLSTIFTSGCVSAAVKTQAKERVAISDGKARLLSTGKMTKEELIKMILDDREGWYALNHYVNDGPEAPAPIVVPTATAEVK